MNALSRNSKILMVSLLVTLFISIGTSHSSASELEDSAKDTIDKKSWKLVFEDSGKTPWKQQWFLDGQFAKVSNTQNGLLVEAGPEVKNDAHHAVLWTKQEFLGDVKIEYDFTKIDEEMKLVNILFIQASGVGEFDQDITTWNDKRQVPSMKFYFERMRLLHISYAAFGQKNDDPNYDYVRARAYPLHPETGFKGMEVPPSYYNTGLFKTGITYKILVEKTQSSLTMRVQQKNHPNSQAKVFTWVLPERAKINFGRIGLRQMYTRSSIYNNFRVYTR